MFGNETKAETENDILYKEKLEENMKNSISKPLLQQRNWWKLVPCIIIWVVLGLWFFVFSSSAAIDIRRIEAISTHHDSIKDGDRGSDNSNEETPRSSPSSSSSLGKSSRVKHRDDNDDDGPSSCKPGSRKAPIQSYADLVALPSKLSGLCSKYCRHASDQSATLCSKEALDFLALNTKPRMDHGCYPRKKERDDGGDERETDNNCLTAIFFTIGPRFYGAGGQEYVWESVRQWRLFHPSVGEDSASSSSSSSCRHNDIIIVVNDTQLNDDLVRRNATALKATLVGTSELMTDHWRRYEKVFYVQGYMHPGGNRTTGHKTFNKHVSERFFAVESLMRRRNLRHVVCLENDVMVYTNFIETVRAVQKCGWRMASMFPHTKGVIPGLMYIRSADDVLKFVHFVNDLLVCGKKFGTKLQPGYANDMTYLLNFYQLYGGQWLGDLPNYVVKSSGENCVADRVPNLIHDGASFGQWYSFAVKGREPFKLPRCRGEQQSTRQHYFTSGCPQWEKMLTEHYASTAREGRPVSVAKPPKHVENAMRQGRFLDATPGEYVKWRRDSEGRLVPYWGNKLRLSSLHIHAKNLYWFRSK